MDRSRIGSFLKFISFMAALALLFYNIPSIFDNYSSHQYEINKLRQEERLKKDLEIFYSELKANDAEVEILEKWEDVSSDGKTMYASINGTRIWVRCSQPIVLREEGVQNYITQSPRGELTAYQGSWYIANVSKSFTDKNNVIAHIVSCSQELEKHYQAKIEQEQKNRKSFEI